MLHRFGYVSIAAVAFGEAELLQLRLAGETVNGRYSVTGLLLFDGERFAQLIEGSKIGVDMIAERIVKDQRHHILRVDHQGNAERRLFPGWTLEMRSRLPHISKASFIKDVNDAVASCGDAPLIDYFRGFANATH